MCCCCSLHHIAGDGWSLRSAVARPCGVLPGAAARALRRRLPALPVQYADYTLWQQAVLGDEADAASAMARQLSYWTETLRDLPEQIELPGDRPRPAVPSHRGGSVALALDGGAAPRACRRWRAAAGRACSWCCRPALAALLTRLGAGTDIAHRQPDRGAHRRGAGRADRVLRQHAGAAHRHLGQPGLRRADRPGAGRQPCGLWPCRSAVRAAGRGAQSGAVAVAASAVPGDAGVRERARRRRRWRLPGLAVEPQPVASREREVRPVGRR